MHIQPMAVDNNDSDDEFFSIDLDLSRLASIKYSKFDRDQGSSTRRSSTADSSINVKAQQLSNSPASLDIRAILNGEEYVASHQGASQYSNGGSSACGLAALNCVRLVLSAESNGMKGDKLLEEMAAPGLIDEALSICSAWKSTEHLELEDIYTVPLFRASLRLVESDYGQPTAQKFQQMLRNLGTIGQTTSNGQSSAVVITRPPEIIACFKIAHPTRSVYVVFDSHPRPNHPDGAALIFNTSLLKTAYYLAELMHFDERLLDVDNGLQWQAQLLANVSGHYFESNNQDSSKPEVAQQIAMVANLELLAMKAEMVQLKSQAAFLESEKENLTKKVDALERRGEEWQAERARLKGKQVVRLPEGIPHARATWSNNAKPLQSVPSTAVAASVVVQTRNNDSQARHNAHILSSVNVHQSPISRTYANALAPKQPFAKEKEAKGRSYAYALDLQRQFAEEDAMLQQQHSNLLTTVQATFECGVCMDDLPVDDLARIDSCRHSFCRDCIRQHAVIKIKEHRFPILCPSCSADNHTKDPGTVTDDLIQQLGLTEEQYQVFTELELANFSILLHCRKCKRGAFVDKTEYQEAQILTCPLPNCNYLWCKQCQQACEIGGPQHSCDGSSELEHLMKHRGWKHCPGCRTPILKTEGCNHMTCLSPGCNTHFCYVCGALIVQSALRREIERAVSAHYRSCKIFEDVPDQPR